MNMQREDFLALTRGAFGFNEKHEPSYYGSKTYLDAPLPRHRRWVPVCSGSSVYDQSRILEDWFPAGTMFEFLGTVCFSKGIEFDKLREGPSTPMLKVIAPAKEGGLDFVYFSVREALSIAKQVSVDTINRLNGVNHRDL